MFKTGKSRIITGIVVVTAMALGVPFGIRMFGSKKQKNEAYVDNQTEFLAKPTDGTTPKDHSILDNIQIAAGVLHDDPHFKGISQGHAITNMVVQNDQQVYTERRVDGDISLSNTVSVSSFKKIATQKFFNSDKIYFRDGKINTDDLSATTWSEDAPTAMSKEDYLSTYGWLPNQLCSYVFKEDSIDFENSNVEESNDYFYVVNVTLDTVNSIAQSKREVKENGGALSYPSYSAVSVSIALDENWKVQKMTYHDVYEITVKMGVSLTAPVDSQIEELFYYDDYQITDETKAYYSQYANISTSDNNVTQKKEKSAMDYLSDSVLGMALGGSTLNAKVNVNDQLNLDGNIYLKFDITSMNLDFAALFNDLYLSYNKELKISYKKYNYSVNEDFIKYILDSLNVDVNSLTSSLSGDGNSSSEMNGLMEQLNNLTLTKDGDEVSVKGMLTYKNVILDLEVLINEVDGNTELKAIQGKVNIDNKNIDVSLSVSDEKITAPEVEYVDLSSDYWIVDDVMNLISYSGYEASFSFDYLGYYAKAKAYIDDKRNVNLDLIISTEGKEDIEVNFAYYEKEFYVSIGSVSVKINDDDITSIKNLLSEYIDLPDTKVELNKETLTKVLDYAYDVFEGLVPYEDHLDVSLNLNKLSEEIGNVTASISSSDNALKVRLNKYDFDFSIQENKESVVLKEANYLTYCDFEKVVDNVKGMVSSLKEDTLNIAFEDVEITYKDSKIAVSGSFYKDQEMNEIILHLNIENETYVLSIKGNEEAYYLDFTMKEKEYKVYTDKDTLMEGIDYVLSPLKEKYGNTDLKEVIRNYINNALNKEVNLEELLPTVYNALTFIEDSSLEIENGNVNFIGEDNNYHISFDKTENTYNLSLDKIYAEDFSFNGKIALNNEEKEISINKEEYKDVSKTIGDIVTDIKLFGENDYSYEDVKEFIDKLKSYQGIEVTIDQVKALGFDVGGKVYFDKNKNASLDLSISYNEDTTSFSIVYYEGDFYLTWENFNVFITVDDVKDAVEMIMSLVSNDATPSSDKLYDTVMKLTDAFTLVSVTKSEGLNATLALSEFYDQLSDLSLTIRFDENLNIISSDDTLRLNAKDYTGEIASPSFQSSSAYTRDDFDVLMDYVKGFKNYLKEGKLSLSFEDTSSPLSINYKEKEFILHGAVNVKTTQKEDGALDKVTFSFRSYIEGSIHYYVAMEYTEDEVLYITFSTNWEENYGSLVSKTTICFTRAQVITIMKDVLTGIDENSEIGKRLDKDTLNNVNTVKKLLVDTGLIDKDEITIGKSEVNLEKIVPIVYKVLDFIKGAEIVPDRNTRSISFAKDYEFKTEAGETLITSSKGTLSEITENDSTTYLASIDGISINDISIKGNIQVSEFNDVVYADTENALAMTSIESLEEALFNSIDKMLFNINGSMQIKFLGLSFSNLKVKVNARVAYVDDKIKGYIRLDIPNIAFVTGSLFGKDIVSEIFIEDDVIYMRKTKGSDVSYRKNTLKGFSSNMLDDIIFIMNFQSAIANSIKNSDSNFKLVPDKLLKSYSYENEDYNIVLDLPNGLTTSMFSDLTLDLTLGEYEDTSYLKGISGEVTLFSVLDAVFSLSESGAYGETPDMSVVPEGLLEDENYAYYNEEVNE